jgi:hypothetical protein
MQPLTASNEVSNLECDSLMCLLFSTGAVDCKPSGLSYSRQTRNLPMIDQKKTSELIETSFIYLLSAAVAVGAFVLVWLISLFLGFSQT